MVFLLRELPTWSDAFSSCVPTQQLAAGWNNKLWCLVLMLLSRLHDVERLRSSRRATALSRFPLHGKKWIRFFNHASEWRNCYPLKVSAVAIATKSASKFSHHCIRVFGSQLQTPLPLPFFIPYLSGHCGDLKFSLFSDKSSKVSAAWDKIITFNFYNKIWISKILLDIYIDLS